MGLKVSYEICDSCGICEERCPLDCIRLNEEGRPFIKYDECWYCGACEFDCPKGALQVELPFLVR